MNCPRIFELVIFGRTIVAMELLTPDVSLIAWSLVGIILLIVIVYAIYHLANNAAMGFLERLIWLAFILLVPPFGAIIYLGSRRTKSTKATV
jgi:type VI protein secretion system component VasK